jgi:hypothetical protein
MMVIQSQKWLKTPLFTRGKQAPLAPNGAWLAGEPISRSLPVTGDDYVPSARSSDGKQPSVTVPAQIYFFLPFSRVGLILEMESITPGICVSFALEEVRLFYR